MTVGRTLQARLLETFSVEANDRLRAIERGLLALEGYEARGDIGDVVGDVFREAHSLKGAAQVVGLAEVASIAHSMESALVDIRRSGEATTDDLKELFDASAKIATLLAVPEAESAQQTERASRTSAVEAPGEGPLGAPVAEPGPPTVKAPKGPSTRAPRRRAAAEEPSGLWQAAGALAGDRATDKKASPPTSSAVDAHTTTADGESSAVAVTDTTARTGPGSVRVATDRLDDVLGRVPDLLTARRRQVERHEAIAAFQRSLNQHGREWRDLADRIGKRVDGTPNTAVAEDLDRLVRRLGGEISELERAAASLSTASRRDQNRIDALADGLGTDLLSLRLVPVATLFDSFPRMVRDLAAGSGKRARLSEVGWRTEVDREILERVKDPVMHLLRNAVDHGIEPEADRVAAGKPPIGSIVLEASQREGGVVIEVRDDGRGVDVAAVRQAAIRAGVRDGDLPDEADPEANIALLLRPGVSTAGLVSDVSGRGVGLDVVGEQVGRLGGSVRISSQIGAGTTVSLHLPLTMIMAHILLVRVGDRSFGVPIRSVQRCMRLTPDIQTDIAGRPALRLVDGTVPIAELGELLGVAPAVDVPGRAPFVVLVNEPGRLVGLLVDDVVDERHVVVNGLGSLFPIATSDRLVAGATLMNEDEVVLILDAPAVAGRALSTVRRSRPAAFRSRRVVGDGSVEPRQVAVLVVDDSITTRTLEQSILVAAGFRVATAEDGARGFAAARRETFDVIVADVEMPSMDGVEMTRRLKADPATRDVPIILLTALESPEQQAAGLDAGADAYLLKSGFDQEQLIAAIRGLVG